MSTAADTTVRLLVLGDEVRLERFLEQHRDSSMFLRANLRRAGIAYDGQPYQCTYVGMIRQDDVFSVAAHAWSGMVLLQAPEQTATVVLACVAGSSRAITGLSGPLTQ